jgi:hypothetical protein
LIHLRASTCSRLINERFLQRRPDGTYSRMTDGLPAQTPMRMIKAG